MELPSSWETRTRCPATRRGDLEGQEVWELSAATNPATAAQGQQAAALMSSQADAFAAALPAPRAGRKVRKAKTAMAMVRMHQRTGALAKRATPDRLEPIGG